MKRLGFGTAALLAAMPPQHCVRVCEEIRELSVPLLHGAYYEVRPPGLDGGGEISLRALLKFVLAMRPDRIVVGEVRGAEAFELSRAVNAGSGFACTVHANRAVDAMHALVNAALMAGENVSESVVRSVFGQTIDVIVHVERHAGASGSTPLRREVAEIVAVVPSLGDTLTTEPLFVRAAPGAPLEWTGTMPSALAARIAQAIPAGIDLEALAKGYGVVSCLAKTGAEVTAAVAEAIARPGPSVVVVPLMEATQSNPESGFWIRSM